VRCLVRCRVKLRCAVGWIDVIYAYVGSRAQPLPFCRALRCGLWTSFVDDDRRLSQSVTRLPFCTPDHTFAGRFRWTLRLNLPLRTRDSHVPFARCDAPTLPRDVHRSLVYTPFGQVTFTCCSFTCRILNAHPRAVLRARFPTFTYAFHVCRARAPALRSGSCRSGFMPCRGVLFHHPIPHRTDILVGR